MLKHDIFSDFEAIFQSLKAIEGDKKLSAQYLRVIELILKKEAPLKKNIEIVFALLDKKGAQHDSNA